MFRNKILRKLYKQIQLFDIKLWLTQRKKVHLLIQKN